MTALRALHVELAAARSHVAKLEKAIACFEPPMAKAKDPDRPKRQYTKRAARSKVCQRCGIDKPAADWWRNVRSHDGLQYACKLCMGKQMEDMRRLRKEKRLHAEQARAETVEATAPPMDAHAVG